MGDTLQQAHQARGLSAAPKFAGRPCKQGGGKDRPFRNVAPEALGQHDYLAAGAGCGPGVMNTRSRPEMRGGPLGNRGTDTGPAGPRQDARENLSTNKLPNQTNTWKSLQYRIQSDLGHARVIDLQFGQGD